MQGRTVSFHATCVLPPNGAVGGAFFGALFTVRYSPVALYKGVSCIYCKTVVPVGGADRRPHCSQETLTVESLKVLFGMFEKPDSHNRH